jgi:hypothetical protein
VRFTFPSVRIEKPWAATIGLSEAPCGTVGVVTGIVVVVVGIVVGSIATVMLPVPLASAVPPELKNETGCAPTVHGSVHPS